MSALLRGRVYRVDLGSPVGKKPLLVVSNNRRNEAFDDALAVRITTSDKPKLASIVPLAAADAPLEGKVLCDSYVIIYPDEVEADLGALSVGTMTRVGDGLKASLVIP